MRIAKKLGVTFDARDITSWEMSAFMIIENEISKHEEKELKKNATRRHH